MAAHAELRQPRGAIQLAAPPRAQARLGHLVHSLMDELDGLAMHGGGRPPGEDKDGAPASAEERARRLQLALCTRWCGAVERAAQQCVPRQRHAYLASSAASCRGAAGAGAEAEARVSWHAARPAPGTISRPALL